MANIAKYGVFLNGVQQEMLHPKQDYRFRVVLYDFGRNQFLRELTAQVQEVTRPSVDFKPVENHSYNSVVNIFGKHTWSPITLVLKDDITNAVVSSVGDQIQKQLNFYEQTSAVAGINYKFRMEIHSLDGTEQEELESWILDGCFIQKVDYPKGDYKNGEISTVTLTVMYDVAVQVNGTNTNSGTTVGGDPFTNTPSPRGGTISTGG